jgi:hypothetical protein
LLLNHSYREHGIQTSGDERYCFTFNRHCESIVNEVLNDL